MSFMHSSVWDDLCCRGGLMIDGLFSILMECLNIVTGLRIMILVVLVSGMDTIFLSFVLICFGGRSVVL